ncbi:hypothetical protein GCM10028805_24840 [Spirosoma harenae]
MNVTVVTRWIPEPQIKAICWTLVHSLWIGLLVAALAGLIMMLTQKASARLRYQLLCGCLLLFVLLTGSVYYQLSIDTSTQMAGNIVPSIEVTADAPSRLNSTLIEHNMPFVDQFIQIINTNAQWIFAIWLLFFALKSLKLISGMAYIHRIRTYRVYAPADAWQQKVQNFSQRLGIHQSVTVLQSQLVKVPVTVGVLKPVILLPVGLLFQLPAEQIDTILWHELAHVFRRDYLMNLLQSLVETIFFFNPALLWISSLIREEREACCDDIVLAQSTSKSNYLEALLAFQQDTYQPASYAMPLGFRSKQLMDRLRRIVTQENKRLSVVEKIVLSSGLILLTASAFVYHDASDGQLNTKHVKENSIALVKPKSVDKAIPQKDKNTFVRIPRLYKKMVADTLPVAKAEPIVKIDSSLTFTSILFEKSNEDMANREMRVKDDKGNLYQLKIADNRLISLTINGKEIESNDLSHYNNLVHQIDEALVIKRREKRESIDQKIAQTKVEREQFLLRNKEAHQAKWRYKQQINPTGVPSKEWPATFEGKKRWSAESAKKEWQPGAKKKPVDVPNDPIAQQQIQPKKKLPAPLDISYDQERVRGVIAALIAEKIVFNAESVDWFGLSNDELIVNGQKQPDALQQRLKDQYGVKPNYGLYYGPIKMIGKGIIMDKEDMSR